MNAFLMGVVFFRIPAGGPFDDIAYWIFLALLGLGALPFVLGPLLIRFAQKMKRSPTLLAFDPDQRPAPAVVQSYLDQVEADLWGCGFEVYEHVAMPDLVPNVKAIFTMLARPQSDDLAIAVTAFGDTGGLTVLRKYYVEFATDFADGFELCTNNSADESAYRPLPHKKVLQFDRVKNAADLWRVHERATKEFGTGPKKPIPPRTAALDRLRSGMLKENTDQVAVGWLWFDEAADAFRPTWKGACLMTWKLAWPVSAYRLALRRKKAKRLLEDWHLTDVA